jgi:hypothetical protein
LTAKRKRLRTLKDIAAYNVAKYTESTSDVKVLAIPPCLHNLVSIFLDTYSGEYVKFTPKYIIVGGEGGVSESFLKDYIQISKS